MGKVRDRFGGMGRFTGWLRGQKYTGVSLITALTCTVESILTGCITAWFGNSTAGNRRALQRVVANCPATLLEVSFPPSRTSTPGGCFCTVWSTLVRISLTKALVLW